jgi:hypothetical protein
MSVYFTNHKECSNDESFKWHTCSGTLRKTYGTRAMLLLHDTR